MSFKGLFIGIDRYAPPGVNWLSFARRDAAALHGPFTDLMGGEMVLLTGEQASRAAIEEEFRRLEGAAPDISSLSRSPDMVQKLTNLSPTTPTRTTFPGPSIPLTTLGEWCARIPRRRLLIVLDCRFSGGWARRGSRSARARDPLNPLTLS